MSDRDTLTTPTAEPSEAPPSAPVPTDSTPQKRSGCRGCLKGCLVTLGIFLLVVFVAGAWFFQLPARLGIVPTSSEEFYGQSSNPWAEEALEAELTARGVSLEGVSVWVYPAEELPAHVAYILVDSSKGATWDMSGEYRSAVEGLLMYAAASQAATDYEIERVAVDHWDEDGTRAALMTAPTSALRDFVTGTIAKDQLYEQMDGYADLAGFIAGASE